VAARFERQDVRRDRLREKPPLLSDIFTEPDRVCNIIASSYAFTLPSIAGRTNWALRCVDIIKSRWRTFDGRC